MRHFVPCSRCFRGVVARGYQVCFEGAAEQRLWSRLRRRQIAGHYFRRQVPIAGYVVDFACLSESPIVEVDGGQHAVRREQDAARTKRLKTEGFTVLRFRNNDVLQNADGAIETIERRLVDRQAN